VKVKLAFAAALKAKRAWSRIPPEQRKKIVETAAVQVRTHGPVLAKKISDAAKAKGPAVAKKASDTAKTQGPVVAKQLAGTAKEKGPVVAKKISDTLERMLKKPS
jgi:acyl-CoA reductase-like NAD-dependent aldehyde dehydrogenase